MSSDVISMNYDIIFNIIKERLGHFDFEIPRIDECETVPSLLKVGIVLTKRANHQPPIIQTMNIRYFDIREYKIDRILAG